MMIERWTFAPMRGLLQAVALLLMVVGSAPAQADTVPGMAASPDVHLSYDPSPVTVRFLYNDGTRDLQIPRKYIVYASGNFSSRDGPIPDLIETRSVKLVLTYPDGEAWSVATREYMQKHGVGPLTAAADMRDRMHIVEIRASNRSLDLQIVRQDPRIRRASGRIGDLGLLEYSISRGSQILMIGNDEDEFLRIVCPKPEHPGWFCRYDTRVTPHIGLSASFVDLRVYGGREFANERIRMIKRTLCSFTESC